MLQNLKENGLKYNIEKSLFGKNEMESLGLWVTRNGIWPINKKLEAILNMTPPNNKCQLSVLVGFVKY